jgi:4-amino-4-deoxy-L-arabinose transferase-like glycosyltransferase
LHADASPPARPALLAAAIAAYLALAAALIGVGPGLGYDETLFHAGAVHMLTAAGPPPFTHSPQAWVHADGSSWPLMMMPYAGAISFYLLAPVFAVFGPSIVAVRFAAALIAAFGMWGLGRLVGAVAGGKAAAATVLALAVHPGFLSNTTFNDSGFSFWMAALGAAALALRGYVARRTAWWAGLVGLACGIGFWTRLNFAWLIAAAVVGALAGFGRSAVPPARHVAAAALGGVLGSAPLLWYLARSAFRDTLAFMAPYQSAPRAPGHLATRLHLLATSLLYDAEHRLGVWEGPAALPVWQVAFILALVAAAVVAALVGRAASPIDRWHRATAVALLVLAGVMTWTRLPVRGHHLLTLVPFAAVAAVLAAERLLRRRPSYRAVAAAAALYVGIALFWDWSFWRGLPRIGGTGQWSDATTAVAHYLDARRAPRVTALDWGFHNTIYVLTYGRVQARELFWYGADAAEAPVWPDEIAAGGLFLTRLGPYRYPNGVEATDRFREELARSGRDHTRLVFRDRRGRPHTELIEVRP